MSIEYKGFIRMVGKEDIMSYKVYYYNGYHSDGMTCAISKNLLKHIKR